LYSSPNQTGDPNGVDVHYILAKTRQEFNARTRKASGKMIGSKKQGEKEREREREREREKESERDKKDTVRICI